MRTHRLLIAAALAAAVAAPVAHGATIPVTTTADVIQPGDGLCSLREAVFAARFDAGTPANLGCVAGTPGEDVVQLEALEYRLGAGGPREDGNETGDLDTGPFNVVRIVGRGMNATVIGGAGDRVFDVFGNATLSLSDLTVRDGVAPEGESGGAIRNKGTLNSLRVAFVNNAAGDGHTPLAANDSQSRLPGGGGAIGSEGQLAVSDSLFSGNRAGEGSQERFFPTQGGATGFGAGNGGDGGAVLVTAGSASITSSTFTGSRGGDGRAGGLTSFAGGGGGNGGAVAVTAGSATIVNGTFQGNRAGNAGDRRFGMNDEAVPGAGGAVHAAAPGSATVTFSTFSGNAPGGSPFGVTGVGASVSGASVSSSILADAGGACASLSVGRNVTLPGDTSCPGGVVGDPRLGPLAANGGSVPTMAPGAGSPAIDAIVGVPCPAADARGLARPQFAGCDAGAVEVQPGAPGAPGGPGGPGAGGAAVTRTLTGVSLTKAAFRTYGRRKSTTVRFTLGEASPVVLSVRRAAPGRKAAGGRCVAPTRRLAGARRCVRQITLPGRVRKAGVKGANTLVFTGRLRGRALPPGRYTLVLTLPAAGGSPAVAVTRAFRILP